MEQEQKPVRVPEPKKKRIRSSALSRLLFSWLVYIVIAAIIIVPVSLYLYGQYTAPGPLAQSKVVMIDPGAKTNEIGGVLQNQGVVNSGTFFTAAAYLKGAIGAAIRPGEYEIMQGASLEQVLNTLTTGQPIKYKVTIPEGWTSQMALARLNQNDVLTGEVMVAPPEGSIMTDTYLFQRGMTRAKLLEDMQTAQTKLLDELWEKRNPNTILQDKQQAVILASIVEKETGVAEERPLVASVFVNRLKQGMRLQSDPTTIYGITGGKTKLDRPLTKDDLAAETPYNTYRINGLPPGPIANPGRAAIEAVLNPPETGYIYFVANGTGGHAFAKTLDEHNANVAKWRAVQAGQAALVTTQAPNEQLADGLPVPSSADPQAPAPAVPAEANEALAPSSEAAIPDPAAEPLPGIAAPQKGTVPAKAASPIPQAVPAAEASAAQQAAASKPTVPVPASPALPKAPAPSDGLFDPAQMPSPEAEAAAASAEKPDPEKSVKPAPGAIPTPQAKPQQKPGQTAATVPPVETPTTPADPAASAAPATAASAAATPATETVLKPGSIVIVADKQVPIPRMRPKNLP